MGEIRTLDSIPDLKECTECTFIGALEAVLRYRGEETDYIELMGMSGAAFRMRFNNTKWSASSIDMFSKNEAADFLGYYLEKYRVLDKDGNISTSKEKLLEIIKQEIDSDRPVIGLNLLKSPNWSVIVGYDDDDLLVRGYYGKEDIDRAGGYVKAKRFPNIIFTAKKGGYIPNKLESIKKSISYSVRKFKLKEVFGSYSNGFKAYDRWITGLTDEEFFSDIDPETYHDYWLVNGLMYSNLYDARHSASIFLKRSADLLNDDELEEASEYYGDLEKIIWDHWLYFPLPFHIDKKVQGISVPGERYDRDNIWSPQLRKKEYKVLRLIKKMEYRAMKRLEKCADRWQKDSKRLLEPSIYKMRKKVI